MFLLFCFKQVSVLSMDLMNSGMFCWFASLQNFHPVWSNATNYSDNINIKIIKYENEFETDVLM